MKRREETSREESELRGKGAVREEGKIYNNESWERRTERWDKCYGEERRRTRGN